jgi:uncharacterized protein (DUF433 family)
VQTDQPVAAGDQLEESAGKTGALGGVHRGREGSGGDAAFELLEKGNGATKRHGWSFSVIDEAGNVTASKELISCTQGVRSSNPCIIGTRIIMSDVLEYLASGMGQEDILGDFPDLKQEHIQAELRATAPRGSPGSAGPEGNSSNH